MTIQLNDNQKKSLLSVCDNIAGSRKITAICIYGPWICGYADDKTYLNVLMILDRFNRRLNTYSESINGLNVSVLVINRLDFERDVKRGWFGEFFTDMITIPFEPLKNREYLLQNELDIKKRIILEFIENIISEFPESSYEFLFKKEYFMYEGIMRKSKLFPPITYNFLNMILEPLREKNVRKIMTGYLKALNELENENVIFSSDQYIKIVPSHINDVKKKKLRLRSFLKIFNIMTVAPLLNVFS
ncbi:hypothetical protein KJN74_05945 [Candidatus Bathyarchaeota archaeon]|nr:hypothetical protein [Candidatus Bathyarchaeota archaeon]